MLNANGQSRQPRRGALSRRTLLRGVGVSLSLPLLNVMAPATARAQAAAVPRRMFGVCNNLGLAFENQNLNDRAEVAFNEAIEWQQRALTLSPKWRQAQTYLDAHTANLARVLRAAGQLDGADEPQGQRESAAVLALPAEIEQP